MKVLKTLGILAQLTIVTFHIWTVIIAFQHGFWSGIISFVLPVISEIYWIIKMLGVNNLYSILGIILFPVSIFVSIINNSSSK